MTVAELFESLRDNVDEVTEAVADFTGSIRVELPTSFLSDADDPIPQSVDDETFVATISEFGDDLVADVSGAIDSVLAQLGEIDAGEILDNLKDGLSALLSFDGLKLPILNIELPDAAGLQTLLDDVTAAIDTIGAATLDVLSAGIQRLADLDPSRPGVDFPEIAITLPDLFIFFERAQELAPAEGSGETFPLPDFESLISDLFDFEVELPDVEVPPEEFGIFLDGVSTILDRLQLSGPGSLQGQGRRSGEFLNVRSLNGDAGAGDDSVTISPDIFLPVTISGGAGDDALTAGGGPTTFDGGSGDDALTGGIGEDILTGADGNDVIIGGAGVDQLSGGAGEDYIDGGRGADVISGGDEVDQLFGGFDADVIDGDAGNDVVYGSLGDDVVVGGLGDDESHGLGGSDLTLGHGGDDRLWGDQGPGDGSSSDHDIIYAGQGNDDVLRGQGTNMLYA